MGRWQPDAQGRFVRAALELFAEHGFEATTVAEIAARAGLTERTFFRYYTDKREVLFDGQDMFADALVSGIREAPADAAPVDAVAAALVSVGELFPPERHAFARTRQRAIEANPALGERELGKLAASAAAMAQALRDRGVAEPTASLAAELGMVALRVAFARWTAGDGERTLTELMTEALAELRATAA